MGIVTATPESAGKKKKGLHNSKPLTGALEAQPGVSRIYTSSRLVDPLAVVD